MLYKKSRPFTKVFGKQWFYSFPKILHAFLAIENASKIRDRDTRKAH